MADPIVFIERAGPVATLVLNRPDSLNALTPELLELACDAVRTIGDARVLILAGAGRAFCVGVDLKLARAPDFSDRERVRFAQAARTLQRLLETMPQPVIARVRGYCLTGGLELALLADIIIASENAQFGDTHAKVGFRPRWGMSQRLPRLVGRMRANYMTFTGRTFSAPEAARMGLILEAVPDDELDRHVDRLAAEIASNNAGVIAAYKDLMRRSQDVGLTDGLAYEAETEFPI